MPPSLHAPTLYLAAIVVMACAASLMTLAGLTQRTYRGFWWWVLAQWLNLAGVLCVALRDWHPVWFVASVALGLQWPLTMLRGLRHFYVRSVLPLPPVVDQWVLLAGLLGWAVVWSRDPADVGARVTAFSLGCLLTYAYVAWMVTGIREWRQSPVLKLFLASMVAGALVQLPRLVEGWAHWGQPMANPQAFVQQPYLLLVLTVGVVLALYLSLMLTYERSEEEMLESHRQLRLMVDLDMLTQLPNRRHFMDNARLAAALGTAGGSAMALLDIDRLQALNDAHGHQAGDAAIQLVASVAGSLLRGRDIVGRLGGDQFIALLPDTTLGDAHSVVLRMAREVHDRQSGSRRPPFTLSAGVIQLDPQEPLERGLQRLSETVAEAKRLGRQRLVVACSNGEGGQVFTAIRSLSSH